MVKPWCFLHNGGDSGWVSIDDEHAELFWTGKINLKLKLFLICWTFIRNSLLLPERCALKGSSDAKFTFQVV